MEAIKEHKNIETLYLDGLNISNLDFAINFKKLYSLSLKKTNIHNIDFAKNHKNLRSLDITYTDIEDFKPLEYLTKLIYVNFENTNFKNLYFLRNAKNIEKMNLNWCELDEIAMIKEFKELKKIELTGNKIPAYQFQLLGMFTPDQVKNLTLTQRTYITQLKIRYIYEDKYFVTTVQNHPIYGWNQNEEVLNLSTTSKLLHSTINTANELVIENLPDQEVDKFFAAVHFPENFNKLRIEGTLQDPSSYLEKYTNLEQIVIQGTGTFDIEDIKNNDNLIWLTIITDRIEHTEELENFENLQVLKLQAESINDQDVQNIAKIPNIKYIDLSNNENITDYSPIKDSPEIKTFYLLTGVNPKIMMTTNELLSNNHELRVKLIESIYYNDLDSFKNWTKEAETKDKTLRKVQ